MTNEYGNLELHKVLLKAMVDFDAICRKYDLKYILHGGSCLGAIRHKGFIPWDDDIDIAMLREDYEKFLAVAPQEYGDRYTLLTYKTDATMLTNVMKIQINNSGFLGVSGAEGSGEAFLDVFPMSDVPNNEFLRKIQNKLAIFLNECVYAKLGYISLNSWKSKFIFGMLSKLPKRFLGNLLEYCITDFPHGNAQYVNIVATANYNGCTGYAWDLIPKNYLTEIERVQFEGQLFYITQHWEEYLQSHYGDYMKLPPEEKRVNKHNMTKVETKEGGQS